MSDSKTPASIQETPLTRESVGELLGELSKRVIESDRCSVHCMLALNHILTHPDFEKILDDDLRQQVKDIWLKLKSTGIVLADPPVVFGYPKANGASA